MMRLALEVLPPKLFDALTKHARSAAEQPSSKRLVSLRLDGDVIDHFQNGGPDWESRLNEVLRAFVARRIAAQERKSDDETHAA